MPQCALIDKHFVKRDRKRERERERERDRERGEERKKVSPLF
jgi:hypothetical protein